MAYSQQDIDETYQALIAQGHTPEYASGLINGAIRAEANQAADPRIDEMWNTWNEANEINAYDQTMAEIVNDPRNADINPNRFHLYVSAAGGDWDRALDLYRSDVAGLLQDYGIDPAKRPGYVEPGPNVAQPIEGESPQDRLHRQVDEVMAFKREQRERWGS